MRRFLAISFGFLFAAFYVLSGGSSYEPVPNSLQAQAKLPPEERINYRPPPEPAQQERVARATAQVNRSFDTLGEAESEADELSVTLTAARRDAAGIFEAEANRPKAELLNIQLPEATFQIRSNRRQTEAAIDAAVAAALGELTYEPSQIRWVKEDIIDLRAGPGLTFDRVRQVSKGAEVAILEDPGHGWVNVQLVNGHETGWVAEWLLTEPE